MAADRVEEVVEDSHPDAASPLTHVLHHLPDAGLGIEHLDALDGVAAAPTAHGKQDFAPADRLPRPRPRTLHVRPLLRQQQVVFGLVNQVSASLVRLYSSNKHTHIRYKMNTWSEPGIH